MKKIVYFLIISLLCLTLYANTTLTDTLYVYNGNYDQMHTRALGLEFSLIENGTAYSVSRGNATATDIVIPETYNFLPVKSIADRAFAGYTCLTSILIPDSITSIGISAFAYCANLTSIDIPSSVTNIEYYSFRSSGLTTLTIPDNVSSIDSWAFLDCANLTSIEISSGVTWIGNNVFGGCANLTNITVDIENQYYYSEGNCLIQSSDNALVLGCQDSVIPDSVTSIANDAFHGRNLTSLNIPDNVLSIGWDAFNGCTNLTNINIPDNVSSIGGGAFEGCSSLLSINIPSSVIFIGQDAFRDCSSLIIFTDIESQPDGWDIDWNPDQIQVMWGGVSEGLSFVLIENWTAYEVSHGVSTEVNITIPALHNNLPVSKIADNGFSGLSSIVNITLPDGIVSVGASAFSGCQYLTSINIPSSVTSIGINAFRGCPSLVIITEWTSQPESWATNWNPSNRPVIWSGGSGSLSFTLINDDTAYEVSRGTSTDTVISIPEDYNGLPVISVAYCGFQEFKSLTSIFIPNCVTSIGSRAFQGCESLINIHLPESITNIGESVFYGCTSLTSISLPSGISNIGTMTFYDCNSLTSIIIPDGVTEIAHGAFTGCESLTNINIPDGVERIGSVAFYGCSSLTSIEIPSSVAFIGYGINIPENDEYDANVFGYCESLTSITVDTQNPVYRSEGNCLIKGTFLVVGCQNSLIPSSVTAIKQNAFYGCLGLTSITIPNSVTTIGNTAFYGCINLLNVSLSNSVSNIGEMAFARCTGLESITIPNGVIGSNAFTSCSSLVNINISDGVTNIGSSAFSQCVKLTNITLPITITGIVEYTFDGCTNLKSITIPNRVTFISIWAFRGCSNLTSVFIPLNVTSIYWEAFKDCPVLTIYTQHQSQPAGWNNGWNPNNRPIVWGVTTATVPPTNLTYQVNNHLASLAWAPPTNVYIPLFVSYSVYRDGEFLAGDLTNPGYIDLNPIADAHSYFIRAVYVDGESASSNIVNVSLSSDSDITTVPVTKLIGNYPNPFNPTTTIAFDMTREGWVNISVYNSRGQKVRVLVDGTAGAGSHKVAWNGDNELGKPVGSGVYFYRMTTDEFTSMRKMLLVK